MCTDFLHRNVHKLHKITIILTNIIVRFNYFLIENGVFMSNKNFKYYVHTN